MVGLYLLGRGPRVQSTGESAIQKQCALMKQISRGKKQQCWLQVSCVPRVNACILRLNSRKYFPVKMKFSFC